jgi:hypothetical protein
MPSPFHQKYSSQSHKVFGDNTVPAMPEAPKQDAERRARMVLHQTHAEGYVVTLFLHHAPLLFTSANDTQSSAAQRFGNLETLKRRQDEESMNRRQSFHDAYGKPGILGSMWNKYTLRLFHISYTIANKS